VLLKIRASIHLDAGRFHDAMRGYLQALKLEETYGGSGTDTTTILNNLGSVYLETGQHRKAETVRRKVIAVRTSTFGPHDPSVARAVQNLAAQLYSQRRFEESAALFERAVAIWVASAMTETSDYATAIHGTGLIAARRGDLQGAMMQIESAVELWSRVSFVSASVARAEGNLANLKHKLGDVSAAYVHWRSALSKAEQATGVQSAVTREVLQGFLKFLRRTGRSSDAKQVRKRIESLDKTLGRPAQSCMIDVEDLRSGSSQALSPSKLFDFCSLAHDP
jgi:tetratricopeptide (TPR) repeat protein